MFAFIILCACWTLWMCKLVFIIKFVEFSGIIKKKSLLFSPLSFYYSHYVYFVFLNVTLSSLSMCSLFFILFSTLLWVAQPLLIYFHMCWCFSSATFNLLLGCSGTFFTELFYFQLKFSFDCFIILYLFILSNIIYVMLIIKHSLWFFSMGFFSSLKIFIIAVLKYFVCLFL